MDNSQVVRPRQFGIYVNDGVEAVGLLLGKVEYSVTHHGVVIGGVLADTVVVIGRQRECVVCGREELGVDIDDSVEIVGQTLGERDGRRGDGPSLRV